MMAKLDTVETHPERCSLAAESGDVGEAIRELLLARKRYKYRLLFRQLSADDRHSPISRQRRREAASVQFLQNEPIEFVTRPLTLFHRGRTRVRDRLNAHQLRCFGVTAGVTVNSLSLAASPLPFGVDDSGHGVPIATQRLSLSTSAAANFCFGGIF